MNPNQAQAFGDVFVNAESLIFKHGRIYPESFALPSYGDEYRRPSTYARFLLKNHWLRRGAVAVPSALWVIDNLSNNYYHWMIEALTRLLHAEQWAPGDHVLLLPDQYRRLTYVAFTLQAFPYIQRIEWIGVRAKTRVQRLTYIPRIPRQPPPRWPDLAQLRQVAARVGKLAGGAASARRIYFSRDDAMRRRVVNEDKVVRLLRAHDFEILHHDPAKPWELVRLSRGAEFAVGVHGAGLTNVIFMQEGTRLLEVQNPEHHGPAYAKLADMFGVRYRRQICTAAGSHTDVIIDLDQLRENLRDDS